MITTRRSLLRWAGAATVAAVAERLPLQAEAPNDIRITEVRPLIVKGRTLFVIVKASNGMFGLGECSPMNMTVLASNIQTLLKPRLIGKDPFQVDPLYDEMLYPNFKLGPMGAISEAIAGVDIALWDLKGKILGVPVYKLLGGKYRDRQPVYFSYGRGGAKTDTPESVSKLMAQAVERGFTAVKIRMDFGSQVLDAPDDPAESFISAIRRAVGDKVDVAFDANNGYSPKRAIMIGRKFYEKYNIAWFEEPTPQYDYAAMKEVATALDVPISAGEHEYTLWQFKDLITQSEISIVQPDVSKCGGLTQAKKIATLALAYNKHVVVHNTTPTVATAAVIHFAASCSNAARRQEFPGERADLAPLFENKLEFERGFMKVPELPGLGLIARENELAKFQ
jgi:L-alanine-DL-glutamate epimerase-like enolase superfamily enzyme